MSGAYVVRILARLDSGATLSDRWVSLYEADNQWRRAGGAGYWSMVGLRERATRFSEHDAAAWVLAHDDDPGLAHPNITLRAEPA